MQNLLAVRWSDRALGTVTHDDNSAGGDSGGGDEGGSARFDAVLQWQLPSDVTLEATSSWLSLAAAPCRPHDEGGGGDGGGGGGGGSSGCGGDTTAGMTTAAALFVAVRGGAARKLWCYPADVLRHSSSPACGGSGSGAAEAAAAAGPVIAAVQPANRQCWAGVELPEDATSACATTGAKRSARSKKRGASDELLHYVPAADVGSGSKESWRDQGHAWIGTHALAVADFSDNQLPFPPPASSFTSLAGFQVVQFGG
jgi:hypothetical protein